MHSSYKSLIKKNFAKSGENKVISTEYTSKNQMFEEIRQKQVEDEEVSKVPEVDPEELLKRYEDIGQRIIHDAKREKQAILLRAQMEANVAEKEAYEKGYSQGIENGYEDGYKKAYEENVEVAKAEAADIISKAESLLKSAHENYEQYLEDKKLEIIKLALEIAEGITMKTLSEKGGMNSLIEEAVKLSRREESIILKVNSIHVEELKEQAEIWKKTYGIKNEIFVLADDFMNPGNAILEKPNGVVKVGVEIGMEQVRKALIS